VKFHLQRGKGVANDESDVIEKRRPVMVAPAMQKFERLPWANIPPLQDEKSKETI
jgi:hypothetical protein